MATYRLQLRDGVSLDDVRTRWLGPLAELGVSHLYLSPVFRAAADSTHGYDVVDPGIVDEVLGGDEAFDALARAAAERNLSLVVDLVPNHMATDHDRNARWWDLLANGPASAAATWFDLDWDTPERRLRGRLLLPLLPDHYGRELEAGAFSLRIETRHGLRQPVLVHPSATTPLELTTLAPLLRATGHPDFAELADAIDDLPRWALPHDPADLARRRRDEPRLRAGLSSLLDGPGSSHGGSGADAALASELQRVSAAIEELDALIESQPYRLARWQTSLEDLSYRRFFDINSLIGVRVDRPEVFDATHVAVRRWVDAGLVSGLRVDHVDGLRDPAGYLERLRDLAPDAWIVVEKITEGDEPLPPWPVEGTTGYDAGELIGRLELDDEGRPALERIAASVGAPTDVRSTLLAAKGDALDELLAADVNRLTESLLRVCEARRRVRDVTRHELHDCLRALLARYEVYRTYARDGHPTSAADRAVITTALDALADDFGDLDPEIVTLLRDLLPGPSDASEWDFVARFQQLTGPTMAKGAEDTAWFRLLTLVSRCEVGADPDAWALPLDRFHDAMAERQARWPLAMTSTTTHDSKRTEDVRVRLALLTQDADRWAELADEWLELVAPTAPDPACSYRLLQTLVGAWPLDAARLGEHALKAEREAKVHTSWLRPDEDFEAALAAHVDAVLEPGPALDLVARWVDDHDAPWRAAMLAHKLLAITIPGVPDLYQGSDDVLVRLTDPDNRGRVDPPGPPSDDSPKRALVRAALACRTAYPDCFGPTSGYQPLWASGPRSDHAVAFARHDATGTSGVVVVAPRRVMALADDGWRGTTLVLPDGSWRDVLSGHVLSGDGRIWEGTVDLDDLLGAEWPVALLARA